MAAIEVPVFKTMVKPNHPDTIANLTGWKEPKGAYVLLEVPQYNIKKDGVIERGMGLTTVNAESRAQMQHHVDIYIAKGGRVLHYGNFPRMNDASPKRAEKAYQYSEGKGVNPWDALEAHVKMRMTGDVQAIKQIASLEDEVNALKAKLAEKEKRKIGVGAMAGAAD